MNLTLTTWQRATLVQILGQMRGPVAVIRKAGKLLDVLELSEQEREDVGFQVLPNGTVRWSDAERRWDLAIADGNLAVFLREAVAGFREWPVSQHAQVMDLVDQLGIEAEAE